MSNLSVQNNLSFLLPVANGESLAMGDGSVEHFGALMDGFALPAGDSSDVTSNAFLAAELPESSGLDQYSPQLDVGQLLLQPITPVKIKPLPDAANVTAQMAQSMPLSPSLLSVAISQALHIDAAPTVESVKRGVDLSDNSNQVSVLPLPLDNPFVPSLAVGTVLSGAMATPEDSVGVVNAQVSGFGDERAVMVGQSAPSYVSQSQGTVIDKVASAVVETIAKEDVAKAPSANLSVTGSAPAVNQSMQNIASVIGEKTDHIAVSLPVLEMVAPKGSGGLHHAQLLSAPEASVVTANTAPVSEVKSQLLSTVSQQVAGNQIEPDHVAAVKEVDNAELQRLFVVPRTVSEGDVAMRSDDKQSLPMASEKVSLQSALNHSAGDDSLDDEMVMKVASTLLVKPLVSSDVRPAQAHVIPQQSINQQAQSSVANTVDVLSASMKSGQPSVVTQPSENVFGDSVIKFSSPSMLESNMVSVKPVSSGDSAFTQSNSTMMSSMGAGQQAQQHASQQDAQRRDTQSQLQFAQAQSQTAVNNLGDASDDGVFANIMGMPVFTGTSPVVMSSLQLPVNFRQPQWAQDVGNRMQMMINQRLDEVELHLDPAFLGPMKIKLTLDEHKATHVQLTAQHEVTRDMLENALPRLRDMLSEQGIQVGSATVDAGSGGKGERDGADQQHAQQQEKAEPDSEVISTMVQMSRPVGVVDHFV